MSMRWMSKVTVHMEGMMNPMNCSKMIDLIAGRSADTNTVHMYACLLP